MKITWLYAALLLVAVPAAVYGQAAAVGDCAVTIGSTAAAITFPRSGGSGNASPTTYLEICNSHASQTLGINWSGGTAFIGAADTLTLAAGACKKWTSLVDAFVPSSVSVVGSNTNTGATCTYR